MDETINEVSGKLKIEREDGRTETIYAGYKNNLKGRIFLSETK